MNWLDVIIIICIAISVFWGMRNGLLGTSLFFLGILIGWFIAGRVSEMVGDSLQLSRSMDSSIPVLTYLLVISISIVLTRSAVKLIKPVTTVVDIATLGINRLAGLIIGLLTGLIISAVLGIVMARFTYEFDLHEFAKETEAKNIIKQFSESYKDEDNIAEEKTVEDLNADIYATNKHRREKYFAHIHPLKKTEKEYLVDENSDNIVYDGGNSEKTTKKRTQGDGDRWLKKIENMINKLKDVRELLISKLYETQPLDIDDSKEFGVIDINKFLRKQIISIEEDYRIINNSIAKNKRFDKPFEEVNNAKYHLKMKDKFFEDKVKRDNVRLDYGEVGNTDDATLKEIEGKDKEHWDDTEGWDTKKPIRTINPIKIIRKAENEATGESTTTNTTGTDINQFTLMTDLENDLKFLDRTLGEFIRGGKALLNSIQRAGTISNIATSLQKKIDNLKIKEKDEKVKDRVNQNLLKLQEKTSLEMRDILNDKNTFSIFLYSDSINSPSSLIGTYFSFAPVC